jgi:hypothetical protein
MRAVAPGTAACGHGAGMSHAGMPRRPTLFRGSLATIRVACRGGQARARSGRSSARGRRPGAGREPSSSTPRIGSARSRGPFPGVWLSAPRRGRLLADRADRSGSTVPGWGLGLAAAVPPAATFRPPNTARLLTLQDAMRDLARNWPVTAGLPCRIFHVTIQRNCRAWPFR